MNLLKTLRSNLRDIVAFLLLSIAFCMAQDLLTQWSAKQDLADKSIPGLAVFISLMVGFSRFAAANLCAWLFGMAVAWPLINKWGNDQWNFSSGWDSLGMRGRFITFCALASVEILTAAICFSH